jgi:hypothetical protein
MSAVPSVRFSLKRIDYLNHGDYQKIERLFNDHHGQFSKINPNSSKAVKKALAQEISKFTLLSFGNNEVLEVDQIFICWRERNKYVFRIDSRNSFNQILQGKLPQLEIYSLPCYGNFSYNFYFVLKQSDLDQLFQIFSQWLPTNDFNIDD